MDIKQFGSNGVAGNNPPSANGPAKTGAQPSANARRDEAPRAPESSAVANERASKVELSEEAQTVKGIFERLADVPTVDSNRVQKIKAAIDEGRYQVSPERIADRLLGRDARQQEQ